MKLRKEIQVALNNCEPNTNRVDKIEAIAQKFAEHYHNLQLQQGGVMACFSEEQLSQINKYGKHQHNRGAMDLSYVSFEFWLK